jgi:hypothetical protein
MITCLISLNIIATDILFGTILSIQSYQIKQIDTMKNKLMIGVVALFLMSISSATFAQENALKDWKMLGSRVVDYTLDHDVVSLNNNQEAFTSLKVLVKNGTLNMHKATIHFANGDKQDITFPDVVTNENDGRTIDLDANDRVIEKVTFWYDTRKASDQKATIEVYGKKS